jgi:trans-AT polyketide synthase/acyltransferase/oxidoreductase domain-containing protein
MSSSTLLPPQAPAAWSGGFPAVDPAGIADATRRTREHLHLVSAPDGGPIGVATGGAVRHDGGPGLRWHGTLPPLYPEWLGDRSFGEAHGTRFPYLAGEMAHGISSVDLVVAMAEAEMLSLFGAGGTPPPSRRPRNAPPRCWSNAVSPVSRSPRSCG